MTTVKQLKEMAKALRKGRENHYYIQKYGDLSVADLLLVLEDNNYHSEETIIEALATLDYPLIVEAVDIAEGHFKDGQLTPSLHERRTRLDRVIREGE